MPAKFTFVNIFAVCLLMSPSVMLVAQCPEKISIQGENLSLDYFAPVPPNVNSVDVELGDGSMDGNYTNLVDLVTSWQVDGEDFTGIDLNGTVTVNYSSGPSDECDYVNGNLFDPLPVELSAFNAHLMDNSVFLSWSTESEQENAGFEIQRSFDGKVS